MTSTSASHVSVDSMAAARPCIRVARQLS